MIGMPSARLAAFTVLAFTLSSAAIAAPAITQILNNSSGTPPGLPNYGIAPSSIFIVTGTGLADPGTPTLQDTTAPGGLPLTLNGASITVVVNGLRDTHKNWWECDTGIAYLVSGPVGWRTPRMMQIYDLSDPAKPVFIRNFGLPGQEPGAKGPTPGGLHGAFSTGPKGNRVYLAYDNARNGVVEILDLKATNFHRRFYRSSAP